jgi:23S rRNA (cytosine1962-C5)-methyltransferase
MASVILKPGREKSLLRRHPWVFSGAVAAVNGEPQPGDTVEITASDGTVLARGAYSPHSQIMVRVWSFNQDEEINPAFFESRLERAIAYRGQMLKTKPRPAYRVVNAESDGLPGTIVDRYGNYLVCQFLAAGAERWRKEVVAGLERLLPVDGIYERSDPGVRDKEKLPPRTGLLSGKMPPGLISIEEGPCRFLVDIQHGHKTGFYLDQSDNRAAVAEYAEGLDVLNCFAYTGGFGIWALKAGAAKVTNVESSAPALELAQRHVDLNRLDKGKVENMEGDVFQLLRVFRGKTRQFDLIILDPPRFVLSQGHLNRASRGYKDINFLAFQLLRRGGVLFTFSCSGLMPPDLFQKIVADAALDAGRDAQIVRLLGQSWDHPTALNFPEGAYLKGLICRAW